jgi:hypothetical protein
MNVAAAPRFMVTRTLFRADSLVLAHPPGQATGSDTTP